MTTFVLLRTRCSLARILRNALVLPSSAQVVSRACGALAAQVADELGQKTLPAQHELKRALSNASSDLSVPFSVSIPLPPFALQC